MPRALILMADGVEEMEAVIVTDILRRARWDVVSAAVKAASATPAPCPNAVTGSRRVVIVADASFSEVDASGFDVIILPGGMQGTRALCEDGRVLNALRRSAQSGKTIAAICAAPLVLQAAGLLKGRKATCHPAVRHELADAILVDELVVADGSIITSKGPGTAFKFALALVEKLEGSAKAEEVAKPLALAD